MTIAARPGASHDVLAGADIEAAEYLLDLLPEPDRRAFVQALASDAARRRALHRWAARLGPLLAGAGHGPLLAGAGHA
ncbi:hypothetical protein, partial [Roseivivax sp. CAU 1761]